jgi:hypothetical protein
MERTDRSVKNGFLVKPSYSIKRGVILAGRLPMPALQDERGGALKSEGRLIECVLLPMSEE